jgi:hypothetical protein
MASMSTFFPALDSRNRGRLRNVRVERARQPFVARDDDQQNVFLFALRQQRMLRLTRLRIVNFRPRHQRLQHIGQHLRIRTRRQGPFLRPAQLRRRDHLHGLGDLPRVDHAANAPPNVENVRH